MEKVSFYPWAIFQHLCRIFVGATENFSSTWFLFKWQETINPEIIDFAEELQTHISADTPQFFHQMLGFWPNAWFAGCMIRCPKRPETSTSFRLTNISKYVSFHQINSSKLSNSSNPGFLIFTISKNGGKAQRCRSGFGTFVLAFRDPKSSTLLCNCEVIQVITKRMPQTCSQEPKNGNQHGTQEVDFVNHPIHIENIEKNVINIESI